MDLWPWQLLRRVQATLLCCAGSQANYNLERGAHAQTGRGTPKFESRCLSMPHNGSLACAKACDSLLSWKAVHDHTMIALPYHTDPWSTMSGIALGTSPRGGPLLEFGCIPWEYNAALGREFKFRHQHRTCRRRALLRMPTRAASMGSVIGTVSSAATITSLSSSRILPALVPARHAPFLSAARSLGSGAAEKRISARRQKRRDHPAADSATAWQA